MKVSKQTQDPNAPEILELLNASTSALTDAIQSLAYDSDLQVERAWLELLIGALRQRGMLGIQEKLLGIHEEGLSAERRRAAGQAITAAARAVSDAAGKIYHPRAAEGLRKTANAIEAIRVRVESASTGEVIQAPAADVMALKKLAGTLMGAGTPKAKLEGLVKARAARAANRLLDAENRRLAKNRGVS